MIFIGLIYPKRPVWVQYPSKYGSTFLSHSRFHLLIPFQTNLKKNIQRKIAIDWDPQNMMKSLKHGWNTPVYHIHILYLNRLLCPIEYFHCASLVWQKYFNGFQCEDNMYNTLRRDIILPRFDDQPPCETKVWRPWSHGERWPPPPAGDYLPHHTLLESVLARWSGDFYESLKW